MPAQDLYDKARPLTLQYTVAPGEGLAQFSTPLKRTKNAYGSGFASERAESSRAESLSMAKPSRGLTESCLWVLMI